MKKLQKILAALLCIALVLSMVPAVAAEGEATTGEQQYCVYGHTSHDGITCSEEIVTWKPWAGGNTLPTEDGNWYLPENTPISTTTQTFVKNDNHAADIRLDLRGNTVTHTSSTVRGMLLGGAVGSQYVITSTKGQATWKTTKNSGIGAGDGFFFLHNNANLRLINLKVDMSSYNNPANNGQLLHYHAGDSTFTAENCELIGGASSTGKFIYQKSDWASGVNMTLKDTTVVGGMEINYSGLKIAMEGTIKLLPNAYQKFGVRGTAAAAVIDCTKLNTDSVLYVENLNYNFGTAAKATAAKNTVIRNIEGNKIIVNSSASSQLTTAAATTWCINGHTTHAACVAAGCTEDQLAWTELDPATTTKLPNTAGAYYFPQGSTVNLTTQVNTNANSGNIYIDLRGSTVNQITENHRVMLVHGGSTVTFCDSVGGGKLAQTSGKMTDAGSGIVLYSHTGTLRIIGNITVDGSAVTTNNASQTGGAINVAANGNLYIDGATVKGGKVAWGGAIYHKGKSALIKNATIEAGVASQDGSVVTLDAAATLENTTVGGYVNGNAGALTMTGGAINGPLTVKAASTVTNTTINGYVNAENANLTLSNCTVNAKVSNAKTLTVNGGYIKELQHNGGRDALKLNGAVVIDYVKTVNEEAWGTTTGLSGDYRITLANASWGDFESVAAAQAAIDAGKFLPAPGTTLVAVANGSMGRIVARPVRCVYGHTSHEGINCSEEIVTWTLLTASKTETLPATSGNYYFKDNATVNLTGQAEPLDAATKYTIRVDLRGSTVNQTIANKRFVIHRGTADSSYTITDTLGGAKMVATATSNNQTGAALYAYVGTIRVIDVDMDFSKWADVANNDIYVPDQGVLILENLTVKGSSDAAAPAIAQISSKGGTVKLTNTTVEGGYYFDGTATKTTLRGTIKLLPGAYTYGGVYGGAAQAQLDCWNIDVENSEIVAGNLNFGFASEEIAAAAVGTVIKSFDADESLFADGRIVHAGISGTPEKLYIYTAEGKIPQTEYELGEAFNTNSIDLRIKYTGGAEFQIREFEVSGYNADVAGEQVVTLTAKDLSVTLTVTVKAPEPVATGITVTDPTKTEYWEGEELDLTGLGVAVNYDDGSSVAVTEGFTVTGYNAATVGTQTITVTYGEFTATFTVTVKAIEFTGITVTAPTKTEYWEGEELVTDGMTVTATYSNGTTATITEGFTVEGFDAATVGAQTITVTFEGATATFTVTVKAIELTGITVTAPTKTEYWEGEELVTEGMTVTATYNNGTTATITEGFTVAGYEAATVGTQTITVTFEGATATFTVTVKAIELTGITVTAPTKTEYWEGEELVTEGMTVTATYSNGTTATITEGFAVTGYEAATVGAQTITVTFEDATATFTVTVKAIELTGITVTAPTKTEYWEGEELVTEGMTVTATYNNGTTATITEGFTVTGYEAATVGTQTITVTFEDATATFTVTVKAIELTGITVTAPTKTEYWEGEELDLAGMTITATYSNGTTATITEGFTVEGYEAATVGTQTVTVTFEDATATFTVTVKAIVVTGIEITAPTQTEYAFGEALNTQGMTVTATYSNGTTAVIADGFTVEGYVAEQEGEQTITVAYEGFTATFTVTVAEQEFEAIAEGTSGDVFWKLDVNGKLTIYGEGAMEDYTRAAQPWKAYRQQIKSIVVKEGVTYIGKYSFYYLKWANSLTVAETVTGIAKYAGLTMTGLTEINYASSKAMWNRIVVATGNECLLNTEILNSAEPVYTELKITAPTKIKYLQGEALDLTGMELKFVDAEGNEYAVTDYILYGYNAESRTTQTITVFAQGLYATFEVNVRAEGYCGAEGENIMWTVTDGKLILTGEGAMADYTKETAPFYRQYMYEVKHIYIGKGITYLGDYAFYYLFKVHSVDIAESVTGIGKACFYQDKGMVYVNYGGSVETWSSVVIGKYNESITENATLKTTK